ncbi:hypothetical protein [Streptomyces sp. VRA16 Mangrove soil]|uniref:hypothetical protein n=1 Tax=Streptomyces sp. VRA16 Mangrove soil TaxID=2817434 RepID=UPI001A9E50A5|nr:hypothetical protein [Streptomyces sp. VRA16 Mangrove soil]MBO1335046.1 hypothetical protein [Streptomyces sp. VRA16 Mangrove soil]
MSFGQGGPQWGPSGTSGNGGAPDWAALAEASEARARKKRWMLIGGAVVATLAVGSAVAWGIVSANKSGNDGNKSADQLPSSADIPSAEKTKEPSFAPTSAPPPLDPNDFIDSAAKDTAPLSADTLFPGKTLTVGGTVYKKGATSSTQDCKSVGTKSVVTVLAKNDCTRVIRATYFKGGDAVTVGVAVFGTKAQAARAKSQYSDGGIVALPGSGVPAFCRTSVCRQTVNSVGRYTYFSTSGNTDGTNATKQDSALFALGDAATEYTFQQIKRRGETQASAAATAG